MLAACGGHTEIVHVLCTSPYAALARQDKRGRDALMFAAMNGHDTCLQILLTFCSEAGLQPREMLDRADGDGNTALHFASAEGRLDVMRTLLAAGADPDRKNIWSWSPVSYSRSVQSEVYFKGLLGEMDRRKRSGGRREDGKKAKGGGIALVDKDGD